MEFNNTPPLSSPKLKTQSNKDQPRADTQSQSHELQPNGSSKTLNKDLNKLSTAELNKLSSSDLNKLNSQQLAKLNSSQITKLNPAKLAQLPSAKLKTLGDAILSKLNDAQLQRLGLENKRADKVTISEAGLHKAASSIKNEQITN